MRFEREGEVQGLLQGLGLEKLNGYTITKVTYLYHEF